MFGMRDSMNDDDFKCSTYECYSGMRDSMNDDEIKERKDAE